MANIKTNYGAGEDHRAHGGVPVDPVGGFDDRVDHVVAGDRVAGLGKVEGPRLDGVGALDSEWSGGHAAPVRSGAQTMSLSSPRGDRPRPKCLFVNAVASLVSRTDLASP